MPIKINTPLLYLEHLGETTPLFTLPLLLLGERRYIKSTSREHNITTHQEHIRSNASRTDKSETNIRGSPQTWGYVHQNGYLVLLRKNGHMNEYIPHHI